MSADDDVQDEGLPVDMEISAQIEVIKYLKLVKIPIAHWLCLTAIEKDCPDQSLVDMNFHIDFHLRSTPQPSLII